MVVDRSGYRLNVGIIIANDRGQLFWGRRIGQDAWQFPQGGLGQHESVEEAVFRELEEEVGLTADDVELLGITKKWLYYRLPKQFIRTNSQPVVVGQKQKWALLRLKCNEQKIRLDENFIPEFDSWRWVDYWYPAKSVVYFKRKVYEQALKELEPLI